MRIDNLEEASKLIKANLNTNGEFGYRLDEMMISCRFEENDCDLKDWYQFYDFNYGNCFRFNGGITNTAGYEKNNSSSRLLMHQKASGWRNGLKLELFIGYNQRFITKNGFRILIHNQSDTPDINSGNCLAI